MNPTAFTMDQMWYQKNEQLNSLKSLLVYFFIYIDTTGSGLEKIVEEIVSEENLAANVNKEIQKVQELVNVQVIETSQKRSI